MTRRRRKKVIPAPPHRQQALPAMKKNPDQTQCFFETTPLSDQRARMELARLLPLWPKEVADLSLPGRRHVIRSLERALRSERRRGRAGHWAYDLARHAALVKAWRYECASLQATEKAMLLAQIKSPPGGGRF